jgi:hypothetical protein
MNGMKKESWLALPIFPGQSSGTTFKWGHSAILFHFDAFFFSFD